MEGKERHAPWLRSTGRVSLRTLILIRWVAIAGQLAAVLGVAFGLGYPLPLGPLLAVIGVSVLLNVAATLQGRTRLRLGDRDAALYIAYDLLQLTVLLSLSGGLLNPFCMMLLAPLTVSATILSRRSTVALTALTLVCTLVLGLWHYPLPGPAGDMNLPAVYVFGIWLAMSVSAVFVAAYVHHVAEEARRMGDALAASQMALAREQRVSALGALAAAAAHELGTPLGTIAVVAKELSRDLPRDSALAEDVTLLMSESERCRRILADLASQPDIGGGDPYEKLPLPVLVETAAQPHLRPEIILDIDSDDAGDPPAIRRTPELLHGLGNLLQNALQFARAEVTVRTAWSADRVTLTIRDDGPGFPAGLLARIGEPYISGRGEGRVARSNDGVHMGLGIFIATTLLEHAGATLDFSNGRDGGAKVVVSWPRDILE
ncbi:ActS/PrrB/RegB family redox-sensitive histidine kinase [Inquilinus sp. CAU 1745]|uniref:ActS/PrrB/RegB family redox-sensitive histidine kinase n=1 Tax=Inquilinus sp. CAU 1745 TaxID=3140369 RepID=UPI00325B0977